MEETNVLFNALASPEQRANAANTIITNYNLPFNADEILKAFDKSQDHDKDNRRVTTMNVLLSTNVRMFIAVIYALLDNKIQGLWLKYLTRTTFRPIVLGCIWHYSLRRKTATNIWCDLYDYYEFDIREMELCDELRSAIQQHIDSKARFTKKAIK